MAFLPVCSPRPKEIRLPRLEDREIPRGRLLVAHPKGEGSWEAADYASAPAFARASVEDYLAEREAYLRGDSCE